ncbi:molybdopterin-dependent oxidoreductase [Pacificoceanicola onchidii]|uniref:molybdopterin-dependent oxidoreductase n=1 Tax=Pacificoceanicola onchidii TaxID=2562685 RepID=UPI0010A5B53E|nr:molybdopterin-dependent oxidoreductase [Pacificoceanicola onchidii]
MFRLVQSAAALGLLAVCLIAVSPARAEPLTAPTGPVLLTVSGAIAHTNTEDGQAAFDLEMLRALGAADIVTETIWTPDENRFTGVPLAALLDHVGATGTLIQATAINDYSVEIPVSDADGDVPIIAYAMDGNPMSRRGKGPLWVIYPFSSGPDFQTEVIYSRSIWQLDRLTITE